MDEKKYKVGAYVRLSNDDRNKKEESNSISNQKSLIKNFIDNSNDLELVSFYVDDGYSGINFERPQFKDLFSDIACGKIDTIIVKDLSRFGRNFPQVSKYLTRTLPTLNVRFISLNGNIDSINNYPLYDYLYLMINCLFDDMYSKGISTKTKSHLEIKRKEGQFIAPFASYGYFKSPENHHKLIIDDFAARIVKQIYSMKINGYSNKKIADYLNEMGILSPAEYKKYIGLNYKSGFINNIYSSWSTVAVTRILKNEIYIGTLIQGKTTKSNFRKNKFIEKPKSEWAVIEKNHEAIIDFDTFKLVNELLEKDTRVSPKSEIVYPLSGLVKCADCGFDMIRNNVRIKGKTYVYFVCSNYMKNKQCVSHNINYDDVIKTVLNILKVYIKKLIDIKSIISYTDIKPFQEYEVKSIEKIMINKQTEIERYKKLKKSLYESFIDEIVTKKEYTEMKLVYDERLQKTEKELINLNEKKKEAVNSYNKNYEWIDNFAKYENITELTRNVAVELIEKIIISKDKKIDITFRYWLDYKKACDILNNIDNDRAVM